MKKKLIAVARVSTSRQWTKGSSIEDQEVQVREYAQKIGAEVIEVIRIQMSGAKMQMRLNQGQLQQALRKADEAGADLAVSRLDRLSRSQIALLQLKEASEQSSVDVHVCSLGRTIKSISSLEFSMMAMIADNERRNIQERVKRACRNRIGTIGNGLDPKEVQGKSLDKRREMTRQWANDIGLKSEIINAVKMLRIPNQRNVANWLAGRGHLTRTGKRWTQGTLTQQIKVLGWDWGKLKAS